MSIPVIHLAYGDPDGLPVSQGVPFPDGMLTAGTSLRVVSPSQHACSAGVTPLAHWPGGAVRWALVDFAALEAGAYEIQVGESAEGPSEPVSLERDGEHWTLGNGRVRLTLEEDGPGVFSNLAADGRSLLARPEDFRLCVDDADTRHEPCRKISVLLQNPWRTRVRVEGGHYHSNGERHLSYRLDVELWAGWSAVRLDYRFFNLEPGADSHAVRRIAVEADWALDPAQAYRHFRQKNYGIFYKSREVCNPAPVTLVSDLERQAPYVADPRMLLDDTDYPAYLHPPLVTTADWLGVCDRTSGVYLSMQDFGCAKPNRLVSDGCCLGAEVWPAAAGALDLPQGRSKNTTLLLAFLPTPEAADADPRKLSNAPIQAATGVARPMNALLTVGRSTVEPAWLAACGEFQMDRVLPRGRHLRFERFLNGLVNLAMPNTKFDVGDTIDTGYCRTYSAIGGLVHKLEGAPDLPRFWAKGLPEQTWIDCHRPVWANNEYDVIHALCGEVMRTGKHALMSTARLAARHNIEVDFIHYSDHRWLHRATPAHSHDHTNTGAYPSHFWTQGLLQYYCLTGDPDVLEVAVALGDKILENFRDPEMRQTLWGFNREVGWTVLALAFLFDITREQRFRELLDEMADYLVAFDRDAYTGAVNLSAGNDRQSLNRQMISAFFGYGSLVEGMDYYARLAARPEVDAWVATLCRDLLDAAEEAVREGALGGTMLGVLVAAGYERTGDDRFLRLGRIFCDMLFWNSQGPDGRGEVKPVASTYIGLTRLFHHLLEQGLLDDYEYPGARGGLAPRAQG